jgi:hypothetical protein
MKWVMIIALWNTDVPQDSFSFYTKAFDSKVECEQAVQLIYIDARERNIQAQGICLSERQLGVGGILI